MALKDKYVVRSTPDHRRQLEQLVSSGEHPGRVLTRARILLKADTDGPGREDAAIAETLGCGNRTVARVRQKYAGGGLGAALHTKKPTGRPYRRLDGTQEAKLIAVACSAAPTGGRGGRWNGGDGAGRRAPAGTVVPVGARRGRPAGAAGLEPTRAR